MHVQGQGGFSLIELLMAMTILSIGLLAVAQLQIMSMRGSMMARRFSVATYLAKEVIEEVKVPGVFLYYESAKDASIGGAFTRVHDYLFNNNYDEDSTNDSDAKFMPQIDRSTDIDSLPYDVKEGFKENVVTMEYERLCQAFFSDTCNTSSADYVRIINVRNIPNGADDQLTGSLFEDTTMKELNVIVLWRMGDGTHSISMQTLVGRKNYDFF